MKKISRLIVILAAATLILTACGGGQNGAVEQKNDSLTLLEWSGYETETYWEPFAAEHPDIQPEYAFFGEDAEALSKAQTGFYFDLVHPCGSWFGLYVEAGLVQPIDTSRLEHFDELFPELAQAGVIDGKQ